MAVMGWRPVFLLFGLVSRLWLWPWRRATRHASARADEPTAEGGAPSFRAILGRRELWGAAFGQFSFSCVFYFVLTWLPLYLVKARGFSIGEMAQVGGLIYVVYGASSLACGWLTDRWMRAGASANRVRKTAVIASHLLAAAGMAGCAVGDATVSVAGLFVAGAAFGLNIPNGSAIAQTLAGPRAAGKWMAGQNGLGNLAGILAPIVTGLVVDQTGQFTWAFVIAGGMALAGILGWGVVIRRVAPIDWPRG